MRLIPWEAVGREVLEAAPVHATIGVFDGVHRGHRALIEELGRDGGPSLVVTFRENPKRLLGRGYPGDLMTWSEKASALENLGVDLVVTIDFSPVFSRMPGRDFFLTLKRSFFFDRLVLGWNFSFGRGATTTIADLGWWADPRTRLTVFPPVQVDGEPVSSSAIRQALAGGDLHRVRHLLGRSYRLNLEPRSVVGGRATVPRSAVTKLLPPPGVYPVRIEEKRTVLEVGTSDLAWESPPGLRLQELVFE